MNNTTEDISAERKLIDDSIKKKDNPLDIVREER